MGQSWWSVHSTLPVTAFHVPCAHAWHSRSVVAVAGACKPKPGAQGPLMAVHSRFEVAVGGLDSYWWDAHDAPSVPHVRSEDDVGAAASKNPTPHTCTAVHAVPSLEKVTPAVHCMHTRSAVAVPSLTWPSPRAQVVWAAHSLTTVVLELAVAVNVPAAQAAHSRSFAAVAATLVRVPAAQAALTTAQAVPSSVVEKVLPATHAAHVRSVVVLPSAVLPSPMGHRLCAAQADCPKLSVKKPSAHTVQTRSLLAVGAVVCPYPTRHTSVTGTQALPSSVLE